MYTIKYKKLVTVHGVLAMVGAVGLTAGMWLYTLNPLDWNDTFVMVLFIVGGTLLLLAFLLFAVITFLTEKE